MNAVCYRCGQDGHWKAQCTVPVAAKVPAPAPAAAGPAIREKDPALTRRPPEQIARDVHGHADRIRQMLGASQHCGEQADLYDSPYRRWAGMHPSHSCQLRQMAAEQAAESRLSAGPDPALWALAQEIITGTDVAAREAA